ncbi:cupin domain-containing protein [Sphingomonas nostoxanthinifaciens]|uniref:cupin domain-containing protein n=1 Tax=Sphingomonas nostoxanthinifaciens TaxID=2872652 RepID=UPI001CC21FAB|nr:cupin domain-containing protein [Sphingomonas nostoxanthinifaciens]UAK23273.1 cupin domain-containing protein [Sphingomonas nostoxanthinifaciens]
MKGFRYLGAAFATVAVALAASAQMMPKDEPMPVTAQKMPEEYWSAKPSTPTPYVAPNKVHWKLSEILAAHRGQTDWVQPIVRNPQQDADYISLGVGKKTKRRMYADDRVVWIVQDGTMKVSIDGVEPFEATKGFMVNVPFRHFYSIETVGDKPSLRFEVRHAGSPPLYPLSETPDPYPGRTYVKVTGNPGPAQIGDSNPIYLDFWKQIANGDKPYNGKFVWDDHFTSNILRGKAQPVPPESNVGHFHVDWTEFWFVMEGKVNYKIEGYPLFEAQQGDVVAAVKGRWHRPSNSPNAPMSTRIPFNPRPVILHNFEPAH